MASQKSSVQLIWSLRAFAGLSFCMGLGFIIWACVIQMPVETALPVGMVVLGSFALLEAVIGVASSYLGRGCLSVYLLMGGLITLGELALIITLFTDLDGAVDDLVDYEMGLDEPEKRRKDLEYLGRKMLGQKSDLNDEYTNDLEVGRYVFLVLVLAQALALMVTVVMRVRYPYEDDIEDYNSNQQAAQSAMAQIQLENLKHSVLRGSKSNAGGGGGGPPTDNNFYTSSSKLYKNVTKKMSQKYGEFTNDTAFKVKWWQKMPGFFR